MVGLINNLKFLPTFISGHIDQIYVILSKYFPPMAFHTMKFGACAAISKQIVSFSSF